MSNLSITEFERQVHGPSGTVIPVGMQHGETIQNVSYTTVSTQSAAFGATTKFVRIVADVDTRILFGANPTALASASVLMAAGSSEYFGVIPGDKVAAITAI